MASDMKICTFCPWESPGQCFEKDGVKLIYNAMSSDCDYALDIQVPFSKFSQPYPPNKRCFVHTEPFKGSNYCPRSVSEYYHALILSHHESLRQFPQCRPNAGGVTGKWVQPIEHPKKEFGISGFISPKQDSSFDGYCLRHSILDREQEIKTPSLVYNYRKHWQRVPHQYPVLRKDEAINKYMFHLAIENVRERGWFTEKLIDCFATHTVPLYFGAPDIGTLFDLNGIIIIDSNNAISTINSLTEDDYNSRRPAMRHNFEVSKKFWHHAETWVREISELAKG